MLRTACPSLTTVTRRLSTLTGVHGAATTKVSQKASPSKSRVPFRNIEEIRKPWKGKAREGSEDRSGAESKPKRRLKPYELTLRLTKLCEEGKMDEAIETLKNMPLDAQNPAVWNTMISHAGRAGRFQLAYQLYIDVSNTTVYSSHLPLPSDNAIVDETTRFKTSSAHLHHPYGRVHESPILGGSHKAPPECAQDVRQLPRVR